MYFCVAYVSAGNQLGTYCGNPDGNSQPAMQSFEQNFDQFVAAMGKTPTYMNTFVDYSQDWDTWVDNAGWSAWSWTKSNRSLHLTPVIGIPMLPNSYFNNESAGLDEIIAGQHDDVFAGIVKAWAGQNFTTLHLRIGWEMNGGWYAWSWNGPNNTGGIVTKWIQAWRHIATVVRSVSGVNVFNTWNPCVASWSPFDIQNGYPGDDVVDVIGLDIYSPVWPGDLYNWEENNGTLDKNISVWVQSSVNREHYWSYPGANQWAPTSLAGWGMVAHLQFAKLHNKPISFCESGVGLSPPYPPQGIADDGDFPTYVKNMVDAANLDFLYINIWDVNVGDGGWCFSDGSKPAAAASWKAAFGSA